MTRFGSPHRAGWGAGSGAPDFRRWVLGVAFAGLLASPAVAQEAAEMVDIPAQPLAEALAELGRETGLQVGADAALVAGRRSAAVSGMMTPEAALAALLQGTGLGFSSIGPGSAIVTQGAAPPPADGNGDGVGVLRPITVTARRTEQSISTIPGSVTVIDRDTIEEQLKVTADVGRILELSVPGFVGGRQDRQQPTNIRGRSSLVLVNGVPQNQQLRSAGFNFRAIDPNLIERIEVVRGANAIYGFGGTGGVINIITRRPEGDQPSFTTRVGTRFQPLEIDRNSFTAELYQDVSGRAGPVDYFVGASFRRLHRAYDAEGDLVPDSGTEFNNDILDLNGNFGFEIDEDQSLRFVANYFRDDGRAGQLGPANAIPGERKADAVPERVEETGVADGVFNDPQTSLNMTLDYTHGDLFGSAVNTQVFYQRWFNRFDEDLSVFNCCFFAVGTSERQDRRIGVRLNIDTPIDVGPVPEGARITWGADYLNYFSSEATISEVPGPFFGEAFAFRPDIVQNSIAGFGQVELPLGDFLLSAGVRHERFFIDIDDAILDFSEPGDIARFDGGSLDYGATLYNLGLVYAATDAIDIFAGFNQGFDVTEVGRAALQVDRADQVQPEPAVTDSYEVGVRVFEDRWQGTVSGFFTNSDLASRTVNPPDDGITAAVPLRQPEQIWGIEATLDAQPFADWRFGSTVTWQGGRRETEEDGWVDIQSDLITPFRLTGYAEHDPVDWAAARVQFTWTPGFDRFPGSTAAGEGKVDGVFLVDASATFDVGISQISVGVQNLLNRQYIPVGRQATNNPDRYDAAPGLTAFISYQIEW